MPIECPCCKSNLIDVIGEISPTDTFAGRTLSFLLEGNILYLCKICLLAFRYPRMQKDEMDELYKEGEEKNWVPKKGDERKDWEIATRWVSSTGGKKRILDVGCFSGEFFKGLGNGFDLYGIEIHQQAAERAKQGGVEIIGNDFSALNLINAPLDVVTSFDVIEHTYNPLEFLKLLSRATRKGGVIIISTGNSMAASWKLMGSRYWYCAIAEHFSFINPAWCIYAANECGLEVIDLVSFSHSPRTKMRTFAKIKESAFNMMYLFLPFLLHFLRRKGFGAKNVRLHPELLDYPPGWITAKDHFIVKFVKK